jgi:hypothetical protein
VSTQHPDTEPQGIDHLAIERLAELAESEPAALEREHLASCARCAGELIAYRRLVALASDERRRIAPPLTSWDAIAAGLHREGLVATKPSARPVRSVAVPPLARRAAVAVILLGSGLVMGRMSAGMSPGQAVAVQSLLAPNDAARGRNVALQEAFASPDDALDALRTAQERYERAAAYLANHDTSTTESAAEQYRTRLAALDNSAETFLRALNEAPQDPVINQYYLSTLRAREATLSKLGTALPVRLSRY